MKRKLYSLLLALCLVVTMMPMAAQSAYAAEVTPTFTLPELVVGNKITEDSVKVDPSQSAQVEIVKTDWQTQRRVILNDWGCRGMLDAPGRTHTSTPLEWMFNREKNQYYVFSNDSVGTVNDMYLYGAYNGPYSFYTAIHYQGWLDYKRFSLGDEIERIDDYYSIMWKADVKDGSRISETFPFYVKPGSKHNVWVDFKLKSGCQLDSGNKVTLKIGSKTITEEAIIADMGTSGETIYRVAYYYDDAKTPGAEIENINITAAFEGGQTWKSLKQQIVNNAAAWSYQLNSMPYIRILNHWRTSSDGDHSQTLSTPAFASKLVDKTTGETLKNADILTAGHKYEMTLMLNPTLGYSFKNFGSEKSAKNYWKKSGKLTLTNQSDGSTVKGTYVKRKGTPFWYRDNLGKMGVHYLYDNMQVKFTFTAKAETKTPVDEVKLLARSSDAGNVKVGCRVPQLDASGDNGKVAEYYWYKDSLKGKPLTVGSDTFESGHTYYCLAKLTPPPKGCFTKQTKVTLYDKDKENLYGCTVMNKAPAADGSSLVLMLSKTFPAEGVNVIYGKIVYTGGARCGQAVPVEVIAQANGNKDKLDEKYLTYQWQRKPVSASEAEWADIPGATSKKYIPTAADIDQNIRLTVSGKDGYTGMIAGTEKLIYKGTWKEAPETPVLRWDSTNPANVIVQNAKTDQEYMLTYSADAPKNGSWTQGSANLSLAGQKSATVYVHTRMRADETHEVGTITRCGYCFTGETTSLKGLALSEQTLFLKAGEVKEITVKPVPANTTSWEPTLVNWYVTDETKSVKVYADKACTQELSIAGKYVSNKTVYIKGSAQVSNAEVCVQYTGGYNTLMRALCRASVADKNGSYLLRDVGFIYSSSGLIANPGDTLIVDYYAEPEAASLAGTNWTLHKDSTTGDELSMTMGEFVVDTNTVTIRIPQERTEGTYYYVCDTKVGTRMPFLAVKVQSGEIKLSSIDILPDSMELEVGEEDVLTAVKNPVNAVGTLTYRIADNAAGAISFDAATQTVKALKEGTAVVQVSCGEIQKNCKITVLPKHACKGENWKAFGYAQHSGTCAECGKPIFEQHTFDANKICTKCGAVEEDPNAISQTGPVKTSGMKSTVKTKAAGKNTVTVTAQPNNSTKARIKDLKADGYTVKYKFYRSTTKSKGYKLLATSKKSSYTGKSGTKGKTYYYKVKLAFYDKNGKLAGTTTLSQSSTSKRTVKK